FYRSCRRIKFPANADISSEFWTDEPLVLGKGEELPGAVIGEEGGEIAACLAGDIKQEAGEVVRETGLGRPATRRGASGIGIGDGTLRSRLTIVEDVQAARAKSLFLE